MIKTHEKNGDSWFYGISYGDFMEFCGDFMELYGDLMGFQTNRIWGY
jgi:hypothetical protein